MNRRKFLGNLGAISAFFTASLTGFLTFPFKSRIKKVASPTIQLDREKIKKGISGMALISNGRIVRRISHPPVHMNSGDTIEFKYRAIVE